MGFEQALVVKQVSQNITSFSYRPVMTYSATQLDRNFQSVFGAGFWDDWDLSDSEQPLEDGSWSVSAFILPNKFLRSLYFDIFSSPLFLVIYTLDHNKTQ